jgi:hypothetical protein
MTTNQTPSTTPEPAPPRARLRRLWSFMRTYPLDRALLGWLLANRLLAAAIVLILLIGWGFENYLPYLNGPPEWRWVYATRIHDFWPTWLGALRWMLLVIVALFIAWRLLCARLRSPRLRRAATLAALISFGLFYHWLGFSAFPPAGFTRVPRIILDGLTTSYYTVAHDVATGQLPPLGETLRRYPELLHTFPLHASTHPPGPVLAAYGVRRFFEFSPTARAAALAAFKRLGLDPRLLHPSVTELDQVAAAALGVLIMLGGLLGALPLYGLVRRALGSAPRAEATALSAAAFWITYPALAAFEPEFDQLYATLTLACLYCAVRGLGRRPAAWGAALGLTFMLSVFFSFTLIIVVPMVGLLAALELARGAGRWHLAAILAEAHPARPAGCRLWLLTGAAVAASLAVGLALRRVWGIDLPDIFQAALRHEKTVIRPALARPYHLWVFYSLYDFLFFAGSAAAVLALATLARAVREGWRTPAALVPAWLVFPLTILALDVSGQMLGENARLWLFLAPGVAWGAASALLCRSGRCWRLNLAIALLAQSAYYYLCQCKLNLIH